MSNEEVAKLVDQYKLLYVFRKKSDYVDQICRQIESRLRAHFTAMFQDA